ncbi:Actin-related protein 2/3 complex subunit 1 [Neolecta irregularis DAH-3]|uniref:Arp2/3 complex 41 kDa subunit n=1 Tax=Neolecta irregularis (strain DAH-3) TaxID=1198029 RepID=A0A1U7LSI8_NEOID|nr:Actin-related protein 2/3 complex subunit 1 [Neolecta irregularis DAH-3]|eukprot:OLL25627.1 Actin-related protein 2/3 complex subunit 1 [Neolecta irregularis DAH-3]
MYTAHRIFAAKLKHDLLVTSLDWAPRTNRIVTCSQDRNANVWTWNGTEWRPTLVLLRINRAATCVKWSANETKFAVGSGARVIAVCYFEKENDWWISKHIKKPLRSTVTCVDWHPNGVLIAAGSTDMKARVFSGYLKDVDEKPEPSVWGARLPFNTLCAEYLSAGSSWIHSIAFSPSGDTLAFTGNISCGIFLNIGHDSSVTVVYPSTQEGIAPTIFKVKTQFLPFTSLLWTNMDEIVAAGYDCRPVVFKRDQNGWKYHSCLDGTSRSSSRAETKTNSAFNMFRDMDTRARSQGSSEDTTLNTVHQNAITLVRAHEGEKDRLTKISASGVDGKISIWDMTVASQFSLMNL